MGGWMTPPMENPRVLGPRPRPQVVGPWPRVVIDHGIGRRWNPCLAAWKNLKANTAWRGWWGPPPLRIGGVSSRGVNQAIYNYINLILRGRFLTVVINHVSKSWDDPPSEATGLWGQICTELPFCFPIWRLFFFQGPKKVCTFAPTFLFFLNNPFMFPDSWPFKLAWLAWIPWTLMVGFVDDTVDGKQNSGEKTAVWMYNLPCLNSGNKTTGLFLPTSTGFAGISEPSKYYFLFKQLPFSGDEFVDFPEVVLWNFTWGLYAQRAFRNQRWGYPVSAGFG